VIQTNRSRTRRCTRPPTALRSARSSLYFGLPAAGELGRCAARDNFVACLKYFGRRKLAAFGAALSSGFSVAAALLPVAGVLCRVCGTLGLAALPLRLARGVAKRANTRHNKALHPTAASLVLFAAFRLCYYVSVIGRRRVSLIVLLRRAALL